MACFFYLNLQGGVFFVHDNGFLTPVFTAEGAIAHLLYDKHRRILLSITEQLLLYRHAISNEGEAKELSKVTIQILAFNENEKKYESVARGWAEFVMRYVPINDKYDRRTKTSTLRRCDIV